jgi:hypothetical protein
LTFLGTTELCGTLLWLGRRRLAAYLRTSPAAAKVVLILLIGRKPVEVEKLKTGEVRLC